MINIEKREECMGCSACYNICPKNAIEMHEDSEGFKYPKINKEKCINCGLCEKICPMINKKKNDNFEKPNIYAAWSGNQNTRLDSTSGGIFSELANQIFDEDGYVCGAIYNKEWKVEHLLTNSREELINIRSSKYLQSDINYIYREIKEKLSEGKKVLFCGSPCQVSALKNYLNKEYDNLYTCDFICRGMNSPKIFKMYISNLERRYKSKVKKVKFKNKTYGWHNFSTKIEFENGKKYIGSRYIDSFMVGYLKYTAFMRPACYECRFKGFPRIGDITLADFWGIENINKKLDNDMGTSMVLVNSSKGQELFNKVKDRVKCEQVNSEQVFNGNICTFKSPDRTKERELVFENIDKMTYEELCNNFFRKPGTKEKITIHIKTSKLYRELRRNLGKVKRKILRK